MTRNCRNFFVQTIFSLIKLTGYLHLWSYLQTAISAEDFVSFLAYITYKNLHIVVVRTLCTEHVAEWLEGSIRIQITPWSICQEVSLMLSASKGDHSVQYIWKVPEDKNEKERAHYKLIIEIG